MLKIYFVYTEKKSSPGLLYLSSAIFAASELELKGGMISYIQAVNNYNPDLKLAGHEQVQLCDYDGYTGEFLYSKDRDAFSGIGPFFYLVSNRGALTKMLFTIWAKREYERRWENGLQNLYQETFIELETMKYCLAEKPINESLKV